MGAALIPLAIGSAVTGAIGAYSQGHAAAQAANYNAQLAIQNANNQKQNANIAAESGSEQAGMQSLKTRATMGSEIANQGASGLDVNKGSPVDVRVSTHETGVVDAMQVRTNAAREAYGYQVKAVNDTAQADLDKHQAKYDETAAGLSAGNTFLGSAENSASKFAQYKLAGGFSDPSSSYSMEDRP